jgi:hypothetical protein
MILQSATDANRKNAKQKWVSADGTRFEMGGTGFPPVKSGAPPDFVWRQQGSVGVKRTAFHAACQFRARRSKQQAGSLCHRRHSPMK